MNMKQVGIVSILIGLTINILGLQAQGIFMLSVGIVSILPRALEGLVALGIETEAEFSGLHVTLHHWQAQWKRLLLLLTWYLAVRGICLFIAAAFILGLEHPELIATGAIATDPAAIGVSLAMVDVEVLDPLFWLLTVESLANDAIGLAAFSYASEATPFSILRSIVLTTGAAIILAVSVTGTRTLVRFHFFQNSPHEGKVEVASVFFTYLTAIFWGWLSGISFIGMTAIAAFIGDFTSSVILPKLHGAEEHGLTPEEAEARRQRRIQMAHQRRHYQEIWSQVGLGLVIVVVTSVMPLRDFADPAVFIGMVVLLGAIWVARFICEVPFAAWRVLHGTDPLLASGEAAVSNWAASSLLGVPSIVACEMIKHGHTHDATILFGTIMLSWFTVPYTVSLIKRSDTMLGLRLPDLSPANLLRLWLPSQRRTLPTEQVS